MVIWPGPRFSCGGGKGKAPAAVQDSRRGGGRGGDNATGRPSSYTGRTRGSKTPLRR